MCSRVYGFGCQLSLPVWPVPAVPAVFGTRFRSRRSGTAPPMWITTRVARTAGSTSPATTTNAADCPAAHDPAPPTRGLLCPNGRETPGADRRSMHGTDRARTRYEVRAPMSPREATSPGVAHRVARCFSSQHAARIARWYGQDPGQTRRLASVTAVDLWTDPWRATHVARRTRPAHRRDRLASTWRSPVHDLHRNAAGRTGDAGRKHP